MSQQAVSENVVIKDISKEPRISSRNSPREVTHIVTLVPCNYIGTLWNDVKHYLGPAIARSRGRWDIETIHSSLIGDEQHLWVAFDKDKKIDGVATTVFSVYPCRKMLTIDYLGGNNITAWGWDMLDRFYDWARDNDCDGIEAMARLGFWKWLKEDGFERSHTIYERKVV